MTIKVIWRNIFGNNRQFQIITLFYMTGKCADGNCIMGDIKIGGINYCKCIVIYKE